MMKGFISDIHWTAIVLIVAVVSMAVLVIIWLFFQLPFAPGKPFSLDITFANLVNRPYLVASSLGNQRFEDREFFEHALEAAVVDGLENSNSQQISVLMEKYLKFYDLDYYSVSVNKNDVKIFELTNFPKTCGIKSYCTKKYFNTNLDAGICNVGRIEIKGDCGSDYVCCREDKNAYRDDSDSFVIVPCGQDYIGMCSAEPEGAFALEETICGDGRVKIDDVTKNCEKVNNGKTPICCASFDVTITTTARKYSAQIPLLYKDQQNIIEVIVG